MASTDGGAINKKVHAVLVSSVKEVMRTHIFLQDAWYNYCHEHAPTDSLYNTVARDPARYSVVFLGAFLQYVGSVLKWPVQNRKITEKHQKIMQNDVKRTSK